METSTMELRGKLATKLNLITHELGGVQNDGKNTFQNFDFVSHIQMTGKLRPLLNKHKVRLEPEVTDVIERDFTATEGTKTKVTTRTVVKGVMHIIDCETGYEEIRHCAGADVDAGGKSFGQAFTEMVKRFEFKMFHVTQKGDKDLDEKNSEITGTDPLVFVSQHPDLINICATRRFTRSQIKEMCEEGSFEVVKVKQIMERA